MYNRYETQLSAVDKWWAHLSVSMKENVSGLPYPTSSNWWMQQTDKHKAELYEEFGGRSAHVHHTRPSNMPAYT